MSTLERTHTTQAQEQTTGGPPAGDDPAALDAMRDDANSFLEAGQAAITRALSGNSLAFLNASRQRGGE